jgi:hypothetical protein
MFMNFYNFFLFCLIVYLHSDGKEKKQNKTNNHHCIKKPSRFVINRNMYFIYELYTVYT